MTAQTVIITGASRGLGRAGARFAAQLGANVVLNARTQPDLQRLGGELGKQALMVLGDIAQPDTIQRLIDDTLRHFGRIDAIINNAAIVEPIARIADADPEAWARSWQVNFLAPAQLIKAALPELRKNRGRVINVSSGVVVKPIAAWTPYCASKAAITALTTILAEEEPEITAIALRPGNLNTNMQATIREKGADAMLPEVYANFVKQYENDELYPPELSGRALAALALYAPHEWSGQFIRWIDEPTQEFVQQYFTAAGSSP